MENLQIIEDATLQIVRLMVEFPNDVELTRSMESDEDGDICIFSVKVNARDEGTCIGRKGITADALRRVIGIIGYRQLGCRIYFKIEARKPSKNTFQFRG